MKKMSEYSPQDYANFPEIMEKLKQSLQGAWESSEADNVFIAPSDTTATEEQLEGSEITSGFQPPIKDNWKVSGLFSLTATDPRHPNGHMGIDMRAPAGTPIYPLAPGIVSNIGNTPKGGLVVNIDHDNGIKSYYAHCSTIKVQKGDKVDYNTQIASVGDSGNAKGTFPHLHFQVSKDGQTQNPNQYFTVPEYTNVSKDEKFWLSEEAKEEAKKFDFKKYLASKKAFSRNVDEILKKASIYYSLSRY